MSERGVARVQVFSDRNTSADNVPISPLLVVGAVHQHLVTRRLRSKAALVVDSGEPREVHHFCTLLAYGADAICPYLAFEALRVLQKTNKLDRTLDFVDVEVRPRRGPCRYTASSPGLEIFPGPSLLRRSRIYLAFEGQETAGRRVLSVHKHSDGARRLQEKYIKAVGVGILKVMAKMGISTLQSYKGAQIFEALGLGEDVMAMCFSETASRIGGLSLEGLGRNTLEAHLSAFDERPAHGDRVQATAIPDPGDYRHRVNQDGSAEVRFAAR